MENTSKKNIDQKVCNLKPSTPAALEAENLEKIDLKDVACRKKDPCGQNDKKASSDALLMAPPPYSDLGKNAKDIFSKGYHFGLIKLDCKTTTAHGVKFNVAGVSDQESGKVNGSLESKYNVKDFGVTFTEKWATDNVLTTEVEVVDQGLKGLKLSAGVNFSPQDGLKSGLAKMGFQNDRVAINADADLTTDNQIVQASAVVGHQGWLAGYQGAFDVQNSKLTKSNFALGYSTKDFILHTQVDKAEEESEEKQIFIASIYQQLTAKLSAGVNVMWKQCGGDTGFDLGCAYELDGDAVVRAKVDNKVQVGLSYTQRLRDGISVTMCANVDGCHIDSGGGHKLGLAIEFEQ